MITETINPQLKSILVQNGDAEVFGDDSPARRKMSPDECVERFRQIWPEIAQALEPDDTIVPRSRLASLLPRGVGDYYDKQAQHRLASVKGALFLAQIDPATRSCNQLWGLGKNTDPSRLTIRFDSIEAHDNFTKCADRLGWKSDKLAETILNEFTRCATASNDPDFDSDTLDQTILMAFGLLLRRPHA